MSESWQRAQGRLLLFGRPIEVFRGLHFAIIFERHEIIPCTLNRKLQGGGELLWIRIKP